MHPILLRWGPWTLYSYGGMVAVGFLIASRWVGRSASSAGLNRSQVQNLALTVLLAGFLGARVMYVALNIPFYQADWREVFRLDHGGLVFYGGLMAGLAAVFWSIHRNRLPFWVTMDLLVPPAVLAHAFGRVGCFLNGCCYGKPASVPWAVAFPWEGIPRHPTALYEAVFLGALSVLLEFFRRRNPQPGRVLWVYGLAYGTWRFSVEFLRGDNPVVGGGLTLFQWWSLLLAVVCAWLILRRIPSR